MRALIGALVLVAAPVAAQTHVVQPFKFLWDYTVTVDRFEFKLDAGGYVNVGLPPLVGGSFALQADPTMSGAHSAVVRACLQTECSPDSNTLAFVVDQGPPTALRLAVGNPPPPPVPGPSANCAKLDIKSPSGATLVDAGNAIWTVVPSTAPDRVANQVEARRNGVASGKGSTNFIQLIGGAIFSFDPPAPAGSGPGWEQCCWVSVPAPSCP